METLQAIHARKSCRSFLQTKVPAQSLEQILLAGQAAPMGRKEPVHLCVIEDPSLLRELGESAAKTMGMEGDPLYGATALVMACYEERIGQDLGVANTATAVENMLLAATELGVGSIFLWTANFALPGNPDLAKRCGVPEGYRAVSSAGLGMTDEDVQGPTTPKCSITISRR